MTRLEALKELAAKVEAGEGLSGNVDFWGALSFAFERRGALASDAAKAYHGSLDAAKALHEAVLPGWLHFVRCDGVTVMHCISDQCPLEGRSHDTNPARAWLLAIIRALIAQEQAQ